MKFVFNPDVILCGWLGSKHQLTNLYESDDRKVALLTLHELFEMILCDSAANSLLRLRDYVIFNDLNIKIIFAEQWTVDHIFFKD